MGFGFGTHFLFFTVWGNAKRPAIERKPLFKYMKNFVLTRINH